MLSARKKNCPSAASACQKVKNTPSTFRIKSKPITPYGSAVGSNESMNYAMVLILKLLVIEKSMNSHRKCRVNLSLRTTYYIVHSIFFLTRNFLRAIPFLHQVVV